MDLTIQALLSFAPILLAAILLIGLRLPAKKAMPAVYFLTAVLVFTVWRVDFARIIASTIQGLFITFDILWIIFGAILLLNTLKHSGGV
ncbi:L-lactate permease, partial [candidate division KSB1 bacterium]|nr:L-lactate permease [candidate division KSB1 bacterium]